MLDAGLRVDGQDAAWPLMIRWRGRGGLGHTRGLMGQRLDTDEDAKMVEHWDVMETITPVATWVNGGEF